MTETMSDRVAKALREVGVSQVHDEVDFDELARTAVAAMREPTKAMIEAGYDCADPSDRWPAHPDDVWQAMIDAINSPPPAEPD